MGRSCDWDFSNWTTYNNLIFFYIKGDILFTHSYFDFGLCFETFVML